MECLSGGREDEEVVSGTEHRYIPHYDLEILSTSCEVQAKRF